MARVLLVVYDNESYIPQLPIGLAYLQAAIEDAWHDVEWWFQDVHHGSDDSLRSHLDMNHYDVVCLSFIGGYWQYKKALSLSKAVNASRKRKDFKYVIGGHGPSPEPEFFLEKTGADHVVVGEGERSIVDILKFKHEGDKIIQGKLVEDVDSPPEYEDLPMEVYRLFRPPNSKPTDFTIPILSGRGCPFKCNFCYRMVPGVRVRSAHAIVAEIQELQLYGVNRIAFFDELLMTSKQRTVELSEALMDLDIKWSCNGRLNHATPEVLKVMKRAGCDFINYGIEAVDDQVLENMHKQLTVAQIHRGVDATLKAGISPGLNIIWGNIGDTKETLNAGVEFLLKYDDGAQFRTIRPVTPYPGSELYDIAIERGLLDGPEDFYENKHINSDLFTVNFMDMPHKEAHTLLYIANRSLAMNYYERKQADTLHQMSDLYLERKLDSTFRGFRHA